MGYIHNLEHYLALKGERNYDTGYNMDEPGRHAKCNKRISKRQVLHDTFDT